MSPVEVNNKIAEMLGINIDGASKMVIVFSARDYPKVYIRKWIDNLGNTDVHKFKIIPHESSKGGVNNARNTK